MSKNIIAVIGHGGRESALVHAYSKSPIVTKIIAIPGNDLMQRTSQKPVETHPNISTTNIKKIIQLCKSQSIVLVDIAQDAAVASGLGDELNRSGILFVGPTRSAGQIEWDKAWSRRFMEKFSIPHPSFTVFNTTKDGINFIKSHKNQKWFIKGTGLADGKAALPAQSNEEAIERIVEMKKFGRAGKTYLIEQWIEGEEFSTFIICDGKKFVHVGNAQDHKRIYNFDKGENTGGMGCSTPPMLLTPNIMRKIEERILHPTIEGMHALGRPYTGVLYLGGIVVKDESEHNPYVIEFNARWGDPEAQVLIPSIQTDFFEVGMAIAKRDISHLVIKFDELARVVVAGAAKGYPGDYSATNGKEIYGIDEARNIQGITIYGAGARMKSGRIYAHGGRLFYIVGEGKSIIEAREKAYQALSLIYIEGNNLHYRTDIGWRDVDRLRKGNNYH